MQVPSNSEVSDAIPLSEIDDDFTGCTELLEMSSRAELSAYVQWRDAARSLVEAQFALKSAQERFRTCLAELARAVAPGEP